MVDENVSLEVTGNGDVLESHDKVLAVGVGVLLSLRQLELCRMLRG